MNKIKPVFLALALMFVVILPIEKQTNKIQEVNETQKTSPTEIEAQAALAIDLLTNEILFEKNIYEPLPLASLTKIISSLIAVEYIDLDEYIKISKNAVLTPEPSSLRVGEHMRAEDLLAMAMGESSNDAMIALVERFGSEEWFVELMREKVQEFGAETINFLNPTGLDIEHEKLGDGGQASNFGSAYDLAQIVKNSLDSIIWQIGNKEEVISKEGIIHKIRHTNILRVELSGITGAKTGFTDNAGGNLVLIMEKPLEKPKLIIILGSTLKGRFEDAKKLAIILK